MRTRETSVETFKQIRDQGLLSQKRFEVYEYLVQRGPLTGGQVSRALKKSGSVSESIRNRLTELRDMGVVEEVGEIPCPVTGRNSILWDSTNRIPVKLRKEKTKMVYIEFDLFGEIRKTSTDPFQGGIPFRRVRK